MTTRFPIIVALLGPLMAGCGLEPHYASGPNMSFTSTDPAFEAEASAVAERWNAAAGLGLRVGAAGVPINVVDQAYDHEGHAVCGTTLVQMNVFNTRVVGIIRIDVTRDSPACKSASDILLHEIVHAFAPDAEHTATGMFKDTYTDRLPEPIDEPVLIEACSHTECRGFQPETE